MTDTSERAEMIAKPLQFPLPTGQVLPLQDHAAVGDGRSVAIVALDGTIVWWCVPNIDSKPLFDTLLDPVDAGSFSVQPSGAFRAERSYLRDSNVLETIFTTDTGVLRVTESLNSTLAGRLPWCELARRIEVVRGTVSIRVNLVFGTRGNTVSPWVERNRNADVFHVDTVLGLLRCSPNLRMIRQDDRGVAAEATLQAGENALVAIVAGESQPLCVPAHADINDRIDLTDRAWRSWAEGLGYHGPYQAAVRRCALALKLLLFSPTGAIAAAATTSLPERIGSGKNWDYRYAWVRDAAYTMTAFTRLGVLPESQAAFQWLIHRLGETGVRVCFGLGGGEVPSSEELDLPGYRASRPVVTGNAAAKQHQHGVYGDIFQAAFSFVSSGNILDASTGAILEAMADECAERWRIRDAGIWELEEPQHYTMSKISCWQALTRAVELAEQRHLPPTRVARWARERDRIEAWVDARCWSEHKRAYTFYPGTERIDASLVLAVPFGFGTGDRMSSTVDAIRDELGCGSATAPNGPWLYRYAGAEREEGCFVACTFWLVQAYATLGRRDEAVALMNEALAALPDGGILSEMVDPETGDFLGNLPQGLSHLSLIHAALSLEPDGPNFPNAGRS